MMSAYYCAIVFKINMAKYKMKQFSDIINISIKSSINDIYVS